MPYATETDYLTEAYEGYGAHLPAHYGQEEAVATTTGGGISRRRRTWPNDSTPTTQP